MTGVKAITIIIFLLAPSTVFASEIYLKNNDRITGEIIEEKEEEISVKTESMGTVFIKKASIDKITGEKKDILASSGEKTDNIIWRREIAAGYSTQRGNTQTEQLYLNALINRNNKQIDEWTLKGDLYYSSADKKMDAQKWYTMGRYAFSFGSTKAWYNFYRLEADHDRFANIYYRLVPAAGVGYWFYDRPDTKLSAEVAAGVEYTDYRDETEDAAKFVLVPRLFFEKKIFKYTTFSEDLYFYPALIDSGAYRLRSETSLTVSVNKKLSVRLSLINEYNSDPAQDAEKNDLNFMSSLVYSY